MAARGVSAIAAGTVGLGALLVWSGVKGTGVLVSLQDLLQGHKPRATQTNAITVADLAAAGAKAAAGAAAAGKAAGNGGGGGGRTRPSGVTRATPPTVGSNPLPRLPVIAPPRPVYVPPQTILTQPPKKSGAVWWKPWTW